MSYNDYLVAGFKDLLVEINRSIGLPTLHCAIKSSDYDNVELLLERGEDVNMPGTDGSTPLAYAIRIHARYAMVELLLRYGANPNAKCSKGFTPFTIAITSHTRADIVKLLLDHDADVEADVEFGDTPLVHAVYNGALDEVVQALIEHGANSDKINLYDDQLLSYAIKCNRFATVKLFLEKGLDVNTCEIDGKKLWCWLMTDGYGAPDGAIAFLVENGLNFETSHLCDVSPLKFASTEGRFEDVRALLERGADPDL